MKKTIYKYDAHVADILDIEMPVGADVLCVQVQRVMSGRFDGPKIWARVDPEAPKEVRRFTWRGTGHDATDVGRYVGTVQSINGALVFHLFEAL